MSRSAVKDFPTVRQSLLSGFDNCALSTKFSLEYERGWSSHPQARGTIFHRMAAKALEVMAATGNTTIPVEEALAILGECLRQDDIDRECRLCGARARRFQRPDLTVAVRCEEGHETESDFVNIPAESIEELYWTTKKWATDNEWRISDLIDVEQRLYATVRYPHPDGGTVERRVTGQLDAVFAEGEDGKGLEVMDWKDTFGLPAPTELSFGGYFQQRTYGLLLFENYPSIDRVTLREFYPRFSEQREATIFRADIHVIRDEISALVERFDRSYEEDVWAPSPGKHCGYCTRPGACPIPAFARGEGRITDDKRAQEVAAQVLVAEAVLKQARASLSAHADISGPIPVKDAKANRVYGHRKTKRVERPTREKVEAALAEASATGVPVDLDRLFRTRVGTRFEQYVPSPEEAPSAQDEAMIDALKTSLDAATKE